MTFNTDVDIDDIAAVQNSYLANPNRGLELVSSLLAGASQANDRKINNTLDEMIAACGRLHLPEDEKYFGKLRQLVELLKTPARYRMLKGYTIVGLGGQFSSGKSSVLNSLLETGAEFKLPENTLASTSVSTYMMYGQKGTVAACTKTGQEVPLNADALEAVSHDFNRMHAINPAQYIDFISIGLPQFRVKSIALLDTPGYNASDVATLQEYTDKRRSLKALRSVDHLVWLISAKEPLLSRTDANFIKNLNLSGKVTVIANKCDQVCDIFQSANPDNTDCIKKIRRCFDEAGIACDAVIPYCAKDPEWNGGRKRVLDFLTKAASSKQYAEDCGAQMDIILTELKNEFENMLSSMSIAEMEEIDTYVDASSNPLELQSLVRLRGLMGFERSKLLYDHSIFNACAATLSQWIKQQQMSAK
ncbi:dynamin family protein [Desulfomicrobium sp. ZS1]|uniref:dynamin family protein n=1 Tax=Desulfomicrobium sp. ZS1 TaxID=2952228 RepID=UPI0020B3E26D|nr:dynamin family protein [Desulfomicrobium sp. ZS1]UTF51818.1 dynamin family protein [Desulfomicrobium sp. ZS1]